MANTINVALKKHRTVNVVATKKTTGVINSSQPVTLKNVPTLNGSDVARLDSLADVVPTGETEGAVPVYHAATDRYIVKKLDLSDVTGDLDGGTF